MSDRLIRMPELKSIVALSRATIYRLVQEGRFPQPVRQGRTSAWPLNEVRAYVESVKASRPSHPDSQPTTAS